MKVYDIDGEILKHSGDREWLEEHGKKAMEEYIAQYPEKERWRAEVIFAKAMFGGPEGAMFGAAPYWWRKPHSGPPNNDPFKAILGDIAKDTTARNAREIYTSESEVHLEEDDDNASATDKPGRKANCRRRES